MRNGSGVAGCMIETLRYVAGGLIAFFGAFIIVGTYITILTKTTEKSGTSLVPLVGPLAIVGGIAVTPLPFSHWIWAVFLIDLNTMLIPFGLVMSKFSRPSPKDE